MSFILLGGTIFREENIQTVEIIERIRENRYERDTIEYLFRVTYTGNGELSQMNVGLYPSRESAGHELTRAFNTRMWYSDWTTSTADMAGLPVQNVRSSRSDGAMADSLSGVLNRAPQRTFSLRAEYPGAPLVATESADQSYEQEPNANY